MRYDGINVTMYAAQIEFLNFQFFSVSTLNHVYFVCAPLGVGRIWNVDPFRSRILLVLKAHAINLSPTLAGASVGGTWRVASVRCQVPVRSGEWQVSGGGVQCKRTCK